MAWFLGAILVGLPLLAGAFPFWLDTPSRTNPMDPKNPRNQILPVPTRTITPTFSISPTFTVSPTFSITTSPSNSPTSSATPTFTNTPCHSNTVGIFEDFENSNVSTAAWDFYEIYGACTGYLGPPNPPGVSVENPNQIDTTNFVSCFKSWKVSLQYQACDSYPPGFGTPSSSLAAVPGDPMNMSGSTQLTFWIRSPTALSFSAYFDESNTAGADGEQWETTSPVTVVGDGAWHKISIPLSSMVVSPASMVGGTMDLQSIGFVWFWLTDQYSGGPLVDPQVSINIDDIAFEP